MTRPLLSRVDTHTKSATLRNKLLYTKALGLACKQLTGACDIEMFAN